MSVVTPRVWLPIVASSIRSGQEVGEGEIMSF